MDIDNNNTIIFFKIWRNKYIRNIIIRHVIIYNKVYKYSKLKKYSFNSVTLNQFPYRNYLEVIHYSRNSFQYDPVTGYNVLECIPMKIKQFDHNNEQLLEQINFINCTLPTTVTKLYYHDNLMNNQFKYFLSSNGTSDLQHLEFGRDFNKPIGSGYLEDNVKGFKCNLKSISFGDNFNSQIDISGIPDSVESISFSFQFNQSIKMGVFPTYSNLTMIEFGQLFNQELTPGILPATLTTLILGSYYNQPFPKYSLPDTLTTLKLNFSYNVPLPDELPSCLTSLSFGYYYNFKFSQYQLPNSITFLKLSNRYTQKLEYLPENLKTLIIGELYNHALPSPLPDQLETLTFNLNSLFNQSLNNNTLPISLTSLSLGKYFSNEIDPNLKNLKFIKYPDCPSQTTNIKSLILSKNKFNKLKNKCCIN